MKIDFDDKFIKLLYTKNEIFWAERFFIFIQNDEVKFSDDVEISYYAEYHLNFKFILNSKLLKIVPKK